MLSAGERCEAGNRDDLAVVLAADPRPSSKLLLQSRLPLVAGTDLEHVGLEIAAVFVEAEAVVSEVVVLAIVEGSVEVGEDSVAAVMMVIGNGRFLFAWSPSYIA